MPIWAPPTPPQDESDVYIDRCHDYLYSRAVIPESLLPPPYIPPKKKPISAPSSPVKPVTPGTPPSANLVSSVTFTMEQGFETPTGISELSKKLPIKVHRREEPIFAPRSLFDRPSPALAKLRRDYRLQKYSGRAGSIPAVTKATLGPGSITFPVVSPVSNKPSVPPPTPVHPEKEWLYMEDYSVLQSMTSLLELPLSLMVVNLAQTPNWDMTSQIVNLGSRAHRSQKQCRQRYENVIGPREEGKLLFEPQIKKKKAKTFIKISPPSPQRAASLLKTSALLAQDNYAQFSKILMGRFDSIKAISAKRNPVSRPMTLNPHMKSNKQSLIFIEHGINFEVPVSATTIAQARYDRLVMERRKLLAAQEAARAHQIAMTAMPGIPLPAGPHAVIPIPAPGVPTVGTLPNTPSPGQSPNPVTCLSPILSLSPTNSASSASEAVAAQKARMAATVNASVSGTTSPLPSVPIPIAQTQSLATTPPPGNLLPLVLSPTTSSAITELIGRGVLTAGTTTTTSSPPKRQYTLQHHHSQLQHQLQLLQHHQLQQKQQQIQLAISQVPQTASNQLQQQQQQQLRQQQITNLSQAPIVTSTSSPSTSQSQTQPLVQLIQTTPTQQQQQQLQRGGPTKQVYITTPQTQPVQMPQQQQLQLQQQLLQQQRMQQQIQQHVLHAQHQHLHQQQQHQQQQPIQIQPSSQPKVTHSIVGNTLTSDYTVVTTLSGETFTTSITPQGISTISRMQPSLLQPIPRPMTSLSDLVSASAQKTPISVSSVGSSGIVGSQNVPGQFSLAPNPSSTLQPIVTRPTITQGPDRNSPMAKAARMSTKPVRQPTPAGTSISVPMVSTPATSQQQRERPAMQQLKRYQVISTGQSNVQGGMNILCASTNTSSPTSLTFLTTPMDPSNPSTSSQQRVSIVPTPVVGSVGSIVTPTSTRLQLVKQQTVGGKTVTRAISDAEMAALFKHGLSSQTRVVTTTGPVQGQITTSSSPIQLSASPLTPAAAQLMSLQESQRLQQQHPGGTSPAGATQLQQPRQLSSQMISIGGMTPSKVNAPTQGPTTLIYTPSSTKAPGTIVPTSTPPTVTKFTPAQLQSIKQNYIRQHNQIVMSSASSSQPTEQTAPGLHQQQLKRIQVFTNPSQPPIVVSTAPTTTTTSNLPISLGSVIITSAASSNTFPSSGMSQPITQVTSTMTAGISPQQRMTTVYQPGSLMTTMSSSTSLPVVNPINQRSHIQLVKQSIGGKVITRQISELEMNEILKQHCSNPQNAGQTLSIHTRPIQQGGTRELPTLPSVIEFSQVPGLQPLRLQPTTSGAGPIPITLPGISGELGSNVAPVSLPGSLSGFTQIQTTPAVTTSTPTISTPDEVGPAIIPVANPNPSRTQDLANTISPEPVSSTVNLLQIHPNVSNSQSQSQQPP